MAYIGRSLGDGERIVGLAHFHWWYTVNAWLAVIVPLVLLVAAEYLEDPDLRQGALVVALVVLAIGVIVFLRLMIRKWTTEIGITSHRFVKKTGFISLHTDEIALPNIEGVEVHQSVWGRIWGYGRLKIEGTGMDAVELPTIANPIGFRRAIETAKGMK
jgi:uncharacterized membrane protein YdbT with pleckstrin-like domain